MKWNYIRTDPPQTQETQIDCLFCVGFWPDGTPYGVFAGKYNSGAGFKGLPYWRRCLYYDPSTDKYYECEESFAPKYWALI